MISDTEIRLKGIDVLAKPQGAVEMEQFFDLMQREPVDYTKLRRNIDENLSIEELTRQAMVLRACRT